MLEKEPSNDNCVFACELLFILKCLQYQAFQNTLPFTQVRAGERSFDKKESIVWAKKRFIQVILYGIWIHFQRSCLFFTNRYQSLLFLIYSLVNIALQKYEQDQDINEDHRQEKENPELNKQSFFNSAENHAHGPNQVAIMKSRRVA